MPIILLTSITSITIALLAYIAVFWMNRRAGTFTKGQMAVLLLGLATDILGTYMMSLLAEGFRFDLHSLLGYAALLLMLVMSIAALVALLKKNQPLLDKFGKYYFPAMVLWVASYATGVFLGVEKLG